MKKVLTVFLTLLLCLLFAFPCFADEGDLVRSSITVKAAPEVVPARTETDEKTGEEVTIIADVVKTDTVTGEQTVTKGISINEILITAYTDRSTPQVQRLSITDPEKEEAKVEIKENLDGAYDDVTGVTDSLGELHDTVETYLDEASKDLNKDYNSSVYGATLLFDIWATTPIRETLNNDENTTVTLRFAVGVSESETLEVLHKSSVTGLWEAIPSDRVQRIEGGKYVDVTFDNFCPVLFLKASEKRGEAILSKCCEKCPSWCPFCPYLCGLSLPFIGGTHCLCWLPIVLAILLIILIICIIYKLTKKDKEEEQEVPEENKTEETEKESDSPSGTMKE